LKISYEFNRLYDVLGQPNGNFQADLEIVVTGKSSKTKQNYWLLKSEPEVFSITDLEKAPKKTTHWDGVRNYQARNTMRDDMKIDDLVLFYHSNADPPAVAGIAKIVREGYPDHTAFDEGDDHFDPKSKKDAPTWFMVDVQHVETFKKPVGLDELRHLKGLAEMVLLQKGSRLSVQPVTAQQFELIVEHARKKK
jgi:predicted RNA-binding protein with PUA-like domain